jgi:hypothetical protein
MARTRIKENAMCVSRIAVAAVLWLGVGACRQQVIIDPNDAPIADARAVDPATNMATETMINVPYAGAPVTVTLDGTSSSDKEGPVAGYVWLSGQPADPDAGTERFLPEGQAAGWPGDSARVDVTLDEGSWLFNLWVRDADGFISEPDTILVNVGTDPVAECMDNIVDAVSEPCRMCMCAMETCRAAVVESACDAACWGLIQCVGATCPNYMEMIAMGDTSCFTMPTLCGMAYAANMAGGTPMGTMAAGACARACPMDCTSMPAMP